MKNLQRYGCFVLMLVVSNALAQPSTQTPSVPSPSVPWQRLEYVCENNVLLSVLTVAPRQVTLIFENTFYPMKQVSSDNAVTLRFESITHSALLWLIEDDQGQLLQAGKVLAGQCKMQLAPPQTILYQCQDEIEVSVQYLNDIALIDVRDPTYGDQRYELPRALSDTGSRFSNGMTTWFVLGEEANLYEETEEVQHAEKCMLQN